MKCSLLALACLISVGCGGGNNMAGPPTQTPPSPSGPASGSEFLYQFPFAVGPQVSGLDAKTGSLTSLVDAAPNVPVENMGVPPVADPSGKFLYVQGFDQDPMTQPPVPPVNAIYCFAISGTNGELSALQSSPFISSNLLDPSLFIGATATGMTMDGEGRFFFVSDVGGATSSIRAYLVDAQSGALKNGPILSSSTYAWYVQAIDPTNKYLYAWTMLPGGLAVAVFAIDSSTATVTEIPGSPFSIVNTSSNLEYNVAVLPDPSSHFVYVPVTTSTGGSEVFVFSSNQSSGVLTLTPGSPYPIGSAVKVIMHPTGKYLYAVYPGISEISGYSIDPNSGALSPSPITSIGASTYHGATVIDPTGSTMIFQDSYNTALSFLIDNGTGSLASVSGSPFNVGSQWETAIIVRIP